MKENLLGAEQKLYLAPEEEKIKNAEEIANLSLEVEKHPFIIQYVPTEKEIIISELKKIGCTDLKQLDFANCVAVSINMSQLKAIKTLDCVEAVEKDYDYKVLSDNMEESKYITYLAGENPVSNAREKIKLALFDTGVSDKANIKIDGAANFVDDTDANQDFNGHGTQMSGIISSVITDSETLKAKPCVYSVIVANNRGFTKTSTIMQAIDWAITNGIKIISMSFGDYHKSALLGIMINRAANCGIILLAASGNDGGFDCESRIMYPAAFDKVLSVGAVNGDSVAKYSNGGNNVDCFAQGAQNSIDINGNAISVIGTSGAAAFVTGTMLKNWCTDPELDIEKIKANIKSEMSLIPVDKTEKPLTNVEKNGIITYNSSINSALSVASVAETESVLSNESISLLCYDDNCSSNDMSTAINIPFLNWQSGYISCPGNEVWYKFTANVSSVHPNGSHGWYTVHTQGSLDTVGYLYDSYGNQIAYNDDSNGLNFNFWAQLDYGETYYIRVKAYGSNTGSFNVRVSYFSDDHGNTPESATHVVGVYYEDKSISGELHSQSDVDYFTFVPARSCVMEIYTEGDTNTYGQLYCASGGLLDSDNNSNGNGNFKITAHLEAMERYYIAVSHASSTGYGAYTLRFKFVKDYCLSPSNLGVSSVVWHNEEFVTPSGVWPGNGLYTCMKSHYYLNGATAAISWRNSFLTKPTFLEALSNAVTDAAKETILSEYGITYQSISFSELGVSILTNIIISYLEPFITRALYDQQVDTMTDQGHSIMKIDCFEGYYQGSTSYMYSFSSNNDNIVYGKEYYRGIFSTIEF